MTKGKDKVGKVKTTFYIDEDFKEFLDYMKETEGIPITSILVKATMQKFEKQYKQFKKMKKAEEREAKELNENEQ